MKICRDEELVKDSIQDLFITLWHSRARLSVSDSIKFYLYASLKRKIIAENKLFRRPVRNFEFVASPEDDFISRQEEKHKYDQLIRQINKLSGRQLAGKLRSGMGSARFGHLFRTGKLDHPPGGRRPLLFGQRHIS